MAQGYEYWVHSLDGTSPVYKFGDRHEAHSQAKYHSERKGKTFQVDSMVWSPRDSKWKRRGISKIKPSAKKNPLWGRKRNPISTISSGAGGGWQAAHAFRQLPDGRVQILTNPRGRVPKNLVESPVPRSLVQASIIYRVISPIDGVSTLSDYFDRHEAHSRAKHTAQYYHRAVKVQRLMYAPKYDKYKITGTSIIKP